MCYGKQTNLGKIGKIWIWSFLSDEEYKNVSKNAISFEDSEFYWINSEIASTVLVFESVDIWGYYINQDVFQGQK